MGRNDFDGSDGGPLPRTFATFTMPRPQWWAPKPDITPFELARAMPVLVLMGVRPLNFNAEESVKSLPSEVSRHFSDERPAQ